MSKKIVDDRPLVMKIDLTIVEHLGLNMYTTLPPVVSEIVANAWDADAKVVDVTLPLGSINQHSELVVKDNGSGMNYKDILRRYLVIGRNRRKEEKKDTTDSGRPLMGHKGIGKLSPFGIAKEVEIRTVREGRAIAFLMQIDEMKKAKQAEYWPKKLEDRPVDERNGTRVTLRHLNRTRPIPIDHFRKRLARRFTIIGSKYGFEVRVNGKPLGPEDRALKERCEYVFWERSKEDAETIATIENPGTERKEDWKVWGWIGTMPEPPSEDEGRGVAIIAHGKLAQEPTLFEVSKVAQYALAYIVGEIHAEFVDFTGQDRIATHRSSIVWESREGEALKVWGSERIREIARDWAKNRRQEREKVVREHPNFEEWYKGLGPRDKKHAKKVITAISSLRGVTKEKILDLSSYMIESFEFASFKELVTEIVEVTPEAGGKMIKLFHEWQVIEAREVLRISEGRLAAIEKLKLFVKKDAKEVPDVHRLFAERPWLLQPGWTIVADEKSFSTLLRKEFPNAKLDGTNRRIDFLCLGLGDTLHVVELKRPKHKLRPDDLNQLENYVYFIRDKLGTGKQSYRQAAGMIITGDVNRSNYRVRGKLETLEESRMYAFSYTDLISIAERTHKDIREVLSRIVPAVQWRAMGTAKPAVETSQGKLNERG